MPEGKGRPERKGRMEGKVAIVTGAGSSGPGIGNGKAAAVLFAREGAKVLLADQVLARAEETLELIRQEGGEASAFEANVTSAEDCRRMVEAAVERYGRLDVLDNNVGISRRGTVVEVQEEDWDFVMAVNVKSIVLSSKFAIPKMMETGGGSIINISSIAGLRAHSSTPYTASKAAVIGLTMSMAADHGPDGIRVNCIAPGLIYSPMVAPRMDDDLREIRKSAAPLRTEGDSWDVGYAALYLASDESRWVNGITLPVDAGLTAISPVTYQTLGQQQFAQPI
ncbi:MAG: SDR family oxidoreductase [Chloroflexi bacterium]|nr:SDR family oxidoreductase [Chloroflexota bacterium]